MPRQFASCPCCGQSAPFANFNLDAQGQRVGEPVQYGTFLKIQTFGGRAGIRWTTYPMPEHMLRGLLAQLEQAIAHVKAQLGQ